MATVTELRSKHPRFYYKNCSWQHQDTTLELTWHFHIEPDLNFYPTMQVHGVTSKHLETVSEEELHTYIFNIGMTELFSYWKLTASPEIIIEANPLNQQQITWWHTLLIEGMGEYFFVNDIDFTPQDFVTITSTAPSNQPDADTTHLSKNNSQQSVLIPLGGGKDSVVTLELFRKHLAEEKLACLLIEPTQAAKDIANKSELKTLTISRQLDETMLRLNDEGYLNGHVPISSLFAFTSVLAARLHNFQYVAISNERSSNEGNIIYHDREINHQYSKTFTFEQSFQQYINQFYPVNSPQYFSFVRPLYELQIAKIFATMKRYHPLFRSCNVGQKTNSWCNNCSKCLFAYLILYPFLDPTNLTSYFGENLLDKERLLPIALELLGTGAQKPFECVGTHEEVTVAFHLCWQKYQKIVGNQAEPNHTPRLLQQVYEQVLIHESNLDARTEKILSSWNKHHLIPNKKWEDWLREALE